MFAALGRRTALHAARRTAQQQAKRRMGGGAAAAPEWTGIDKVVRGYFPKDEDSEFFFIVLLFSHYFRWFVWVVSRLCNSSELHGWTLRS